MLLTVSAIAGEWRIRNVLSSRLKIKPMASPGRLSKIGLNGVNGTFEASANMFGWMACEGGRKGPGIN